MATYLSPKSAIDAVLSGLRALDSGPLQSVTAGGGVIYRKGPQRSVKLSGTETAVIFVALAEMPEGEQSAGSGNNWRHEWDIKVLACVPDDGTEACEDLRLDIIDALLQFAHDNRDLAGAARVVRVGKCRCLIGELFADDKQVYRMADITLTYKTLKS